VQIIQPFQCDKFITSTREETVFLPGLTTECKPNAEGCKQSHFNF